MEFRSVVIRNWLWLARPCCYSNGPSANWRSYERWIILKIRSFSDEKKMVDMSSWVAVGHKTFEQNKNAIKNWNENVRQMGELNSSRASAQCVDESFYLAHISGAQCTFGADSQTPGYLISHVRILHTWLHSNIIIINTIYQIKFAHFNLIMFIMLLQFCACSSNSHSHLSAAYVPYIRSQFIS